MLLLFLSILGCARHSPHVERLPDGPAVVPALQDGADEVLERGARLYRTASCVGCHSPPFDDATHLGGGRDLPTIFGVFYAPNISPDPEHGIGGWTEADFTRAMREGRAPDGHRYWPTFPYMTYTAMSDADVHALWVYLQSQPAVPTPSRPHEVKAPYGMPGMLGLWRTVAFRKGPLDGDPAADESWNRGQYLVRAVSYCDQCHTPRSALGLVKKRHFMAGGANPAKADVHPNLTSDPEVGIGTWSEDDLVHYLQTGQKPDGTVTDAKDIMAEKIHDSFSHHTPDDLRAIAEYVHSLPPDDFDPADWGLVKRRRRRLAR
ncbi:MAG: cytochrome c [Myxococcota bacterium]